MKADGDRRRIGRCSRCRRCFEQEKGVVGDCYPYPHRRKLHASRGWSCISCKTDSTLTNSRYARIIIIGRNIYVEIFLSRNDR